MINQCNIVLLSKTMEKIDIHPWLYNFEHLSSRPTIINQIFSLII